MQEVFYYDGIKIGNEIQRLRESKNGDNLPKLSQAQLAKHLGVSAKTVHNWERGTKKFSIDHLYALSNYFGVTADQILGFTA